MKKFLNILTVIVCLFISSLVIPEEDSGLTFDSLGRTVTELIILVCTGLVLWLINRKNQS